MQNEVQDTLDEVQDTLDARREHFQEKKDRRIERFEQAAENAAQRSDAYYKKSGEGLPEFGQPILIGHHSEKGHRRALERSWNNMDKSVEESRKSEYYSEKAESARSNDSISSDDPDAIQKLQKKLDYLQREQDRKKAVNKVVKSTKFKKLTDSQQRIDYVIEKLGCSDLIAAGHIKGHGNSFDGPGYPQWELSNASQNINRIKKRIQDLESSLKVMEEDGGCKEIRIESLCLTVYRNHIENRYQIEFDRRLSRDAFSLLTKNYGFRKTREGLFQRNLSTLGNCLMLERGDAPYTFYRSLKELADAENLLVNC
jgi:hypothetical protein